MTADTNELLQSQNEAEGFTDADLRPSAISIGGLWSIIVAIIVALLILSDMPILLKHLRRGVSDKV